MQLLLDGENNTAYTLTVMDMSQSWICRLLEVYSVVSRLFNHSK